MTPGKMAKRSSAFLKNTLFWSRFCTPLGLRQSVSNPSRPGRAIQHTTLATQHLCFLFVVAKIWKHSGLVGISYSDQYAERGLFQRLMKRRRDIATGTGKFLAGARQAADTGACCSVIGVAKHISARKTARNLCAKLALNDGK